MSKDRDPSWAAVGIDTSNMKEIKLPGKRGPSVFHPGTDEQIKEYEEGLERRHRFIVKYCASRGWPSDASELSMDQIMEVRKQPGWIDPE